MTGHSHTAGHASIRPSLWAGLALAARRADRSNPRHAEPTVSWFLSHTRTSTNTNPVSQPQASRSKLHSWYHHRSIDTGGWAIRMHNGKPQVRAPGWIDPGGTWHDTGTEHRKPKLGE